MIPLCVPLLSIYLLVLEDIPSRAHTQKHTKTPKNTQKHPKNATRRVRLVYIAKTGARVSATKLASPHFYIFVKFERSNAQPFMRNNFVICARDGRQRGRERGKVIACVGETSFECQCCFTFCRVFQHKKQRTGF